MKSKRSHSKLYISRQMFVNEWGTVEPIAEYVKDMKKLFPMQQIVAELEKLKSLNVLVIGDTIVDEYIFTLPKGRATKDPILSLDFVKKDKYAGGILAIANHVAQFAGSVTLVSMLGDYNSEETFVKSKLQKNIKPVFFTKKNSPTTNKQRYIDHVRGGKLMKVEYINDAPIDKETEEKISAFLKKELPNYDLVIVGDFGHGFINAELAKVLQNNAKALAANVQTNSSNMGYNYVTKYNKADYLVTNEQELRLAMRDRFGDLKELLSKLNETTEFKNILLTMGGSGCLYMNNNALFSSPGFTTDVKDAVGAGDAVFSVTALLHHKEVDGNLLPFIANSVGAMAVKIMGNEKSISKKELIDFMGGLYEMGRL
jgi:rfaE bifunctional protein kinase chain/domain